MSIQKLERALDFRDNYEAKVKAAAAFVRDKLGDHKPVFGVVLGSGLGDLADSIEQATVIPYAEIPNFPTTTVPGHEGNLLIGELEGIPVIGLKGRKHYYEVADEPLNNAILQVVFPVHVLAELGVGNYFATNAAGGLNQNYDVGDIMILGSHINLIPSALSGRHHNFSRVDGNGQVWRFQPMNSAYDPQLRQMLREAGETHERNVHEGVYLSEISKRVLDDLFAAHEGHVHEGVYLAVTGPTYETEGESIAFRDGFKADAVGMSTTPEVIVARNRGMKAVGMSCITNKIAADGTNATNHEEVKAILESPAVRDRLSSTVQTFFRLYRESSGLD